MKTVLIHAYECTPYHRPGSTIGAQRPYQFAKHLPKFGWRAIVLCCDYSRRYMLDPRGDWKEVIRKQVQDALEGWDGHDSLTIPLPSLQYADRVDRLWLDTVTMDLPKGVFAPKPGVWTGIKRKLSTLLKLSRGDHSQSWQAVAVYATELILKSGLLPQLQIAAHGPDAGLFVARKFKYKIPTVFDFRDPIDRDFKPIVKIIYRYLVAKKFSYSIGIVNVNPFLATLDAQRFGKPSIDISNGFDPEEFGAIGENLDHNVLTIGWFGNIQSGQEIQPFFDTLKRLDAAVNIKIVFRGSSALQYCKTLKNIGIGNHIILDFAEAVPRPEALRLMRTCDILLLLSLLDPGVEYLSHGLVPGKTFEYLATHKPILVVPGDKAMLDQFILANAFGKIGRDADQIAKLIEEAHFQKKSGEAIWGIKYTQENIADYSRENQAGKLAIFMDQLLISRSTCAV